METYNCIKCSVPAHDTFMNMLCVEDDCKQKGLICAECLLEHHRNHNIITLKRFLGILNHISTRTDHQISTSAPPYRNSHFENMQKIQQYKLEIKTALEKYKKNFVATANEFWRELDLSVNTQLLEWELKLKPIAEYLKNYLHASRRKYIQEHSNNGANVEKQSPSKMAEEKVDFSVNKLERLVKQFLNDSIKIVSPDTYEVRNMQDQELLLSETLEHWKDIHSRVKNDLCFFEKNLLKTLSYYNNQDRVCNKETQTTAQNKDVTKDEGEISPSTENFFSSTELATIIQRGLGGLNLQPEIQAGMKKGSLLDRLTKFSDVNNTRYKNQTNTIWLKSQLYTYQHIIDPLYSGEEEVSCAFCFGSSLESEYFNVLGRMHGPFKTPKENFYCHELCAIWTSGVLPDNPLKYSVTPFFPQEINRSRKLKCSLCKTGGAGLGCNVSSCKKTYHFRCAIKHQAGVHLSFAKYLLYCPNHKSEIKESDEVKKDVYMKIIEKCESDSEDSDNSERNNDDEDAESSNGKKKDDNSIENEDGDKDTKVQEEENDQGVLKKKIGKVQKDVVVKKEEKERKKANPSDGEETPEVHRNKISLRENTLNSKRINKINLTQPGTKKHKSLLV